MKYLGKITDNKDLVTKEYVDVRVGNSCVFYGTCSSAGDATAKVVTCSDFASTDLVAGAIITVKFDNTNSGAVGSLTLNVNGTGAKSIKYIYNGSYSNIPSAGYIKTNQIYQFTYDGTYWIVQMIYNTDADWRVKADYGRFTAGASGLLPYALVLKASDGRWESITTTSTTAKTKAKNTTGFLLNSIFYRLAGSSVAVGEIDSTWTMCSCAVCDARYHLNIENTTALKLVNGKSLYLVGTIGQDGLFYLDDTWWAQDLPTSNDGKYYVYLGTIYSWYQYNLDVFHPIYKYVGNKVRNVSLDSISVNGHTVNADVPSGAKFTDTVTTATTSGNGNAVTAISASNGALTVTKGTTFLTSHQDISGKADKSATVSTVTWDSTNKKLTKTINGTTSDVVTAATLRTGLNVANGAEVNQNAFSNVKVGSTTVAADSKTDTLELVAGDNVTLTPDATNDKITISASGGGGSSTATPTANTISKFDSSAKMNSTDMTDAQIETYLDDIDYTPTVVNDTVPIGAIQAFGGANAPKNWLICDGSAISRTTYAKLFSVIGTTYGTGNGSTTFNLPNLTGKVAVGSGTNYSLGATGGKEKLTLSASIGAAHGQASTVQYIAESVNAYQSSLGTGTYTVTGTNQGALGWSHSTPVTEFSSSDRDTTNMQPYVVTNYIIKYDDKEVSGGALKQIHEYLSDSFKIDELLNVSSGLAANTTYTLSQDASSYDLLYFTALSSYNNRWTMTVPAAIFTSSTTQTYVFSLGIENAVYNIQLRHNGSKKILISGCGTGTVGIIVTGIKMWGTA